MTSFKQPNLTAPAGSQRGGTVRGEEPLSLQILSQLVDTEQATVHKIGRVVELFHKPLGEKGRGILSFAQHWTLFSNLATLHESQKNVLDALQQVLSTLRQERANVVEHKRQILLLQHRIAQRKRNQQQQLLLQKQQQNQNGEPSSSLSHNNINANGGTSFTKSRNPPKINATHHRHVSSTGSAAATIGTVVGATTSTASVGQATLSNPIRSPTTSRLGQLRAAAASTATTTAATTVPTAPVMSPEVPRPSEPSAHHAADGTAPTTTHMDPLSLSEEVNFFSPSNTMRSSDVTPTTIVTAGQHRLPPSSESPQHNGPQDPSSSTSPTVFGSPRRSLGNTTGGAEAWGDQCHSRVTTGDIGDHHSEPAADRADGEVDELSSHPLLRSGPDAPALATPPRGAAAAAASYQLTLPPSHGGNNSDDNLDHVKEVESFGIDGEESSLAQTADGALQPAEASPQHVASDDMIDNDNSGDAAALAQLLAEADDDVNDDYAIDSSLVVALFRGPEMMHFLAEHMMYTLHCCRTIIPTLCSLIDGVRLLRAQHLMQSSQFSNRFGFGAGAVAGGSGNAAASSGGHVRGSAPLLGGGGKVHSEVSTSGGVAASGSESPRKSSIAGFNIAALAAAAGGGDQRLAAVVKFEKFVGFTMETLSNSSDTLDLEKRFLPEVDPLANVQKLSATSPLEELLLHLTCPLPSLQRYLHAARCLVECQCFGESAEKDLTENFISLAFERGAQECTLVLDQISQQDVGAIMRNMDDVSLPLNESRVLIHCGRLTKRFRRGRHDRLMFVFSDALCYVEELSNGRYRVRGQILLESTATAASGGGTSAQELSLPSPQRSSTAAVPAMEASRRMSSATAALHASPSGVHTIDVEDNPSENIFNAFHLVVPATGITYLFLTRDAVQKRTWLDVFEFAFHVSRRSRMVAERQQQTGEGPSLVRNEVQTLPQTSRLERQRRDDYRVQRKADRAQQAAAAAAAADLVPSAALSAAASITTPSVDAQRRVKQRTFSIGSAATAVVGGGRNSPPPPPATAVSSTQLSSFAPHSHQRGESSGSIEPTTPLAGPHESAGSSVGSPSGLRHSFRSGPSLLLPSGGTGHLDAAAATSQSTKASIRRQASLRGSYTAAQWAVELSSSAGHLRVMSTDLLDTPLLPPPPLPNITATELPQLQVPPPGSDRKSPSISVEQPTTVAKLSTTSKSSAFEEFGIKMPPPAHLRASMGCTPLGSTHANVLAAVLAAATAAAAQEEGGAADDDAARSTTAPQDAEDGAAGSPIAHPSTESDTAASTFPVET